MVPISNKEEEDKTCCSFWISRQLYVTPRNAGNRFSNQHSNRKAQSPFKLFSKTRQLIYKDKYTLSWKGKHHTIKNVFSFFFFGKVQTDYLNAKATKYIQPERVSFFLIYICTYMTVTDTRQKKQAIFTLFLLLSNVRQCFSDAIGTQYLGCTPSGILEYTWWNAIPCGRLVWGVVDTKIKFH